MKFKEKILELLDAVEDGRGSAVDLYKSIRIYKDFISQVEETLKPMVMSELNNNGAKEMVVGNCVFTRKNSPDSYDFEENDDYRNLNEKLKSLKKKITIASKHGHSFLDNDSGEVINPVRVKKYGGETFSFSIKK